MFDHETIWLCIDRLAQKHGYSASGLAQKAGLDSTTFNKSKRTASNGKPRWPSTESIAKILSVTGTSMQDFLASAQSIGSSETVSAENSSATIPLLGLAQAGREGFFDADGFPSGEGWDQVELPLTQSKDTSHFFALKVTGQSMEPVYRENDILLLSPSDDIRRNDRVVIKTADGEVMAKQVASIDADVVNLQSLNPEYEDYSLNKSGIDWIYRIIWVSQ